MQIYSESKELPPFRTHDHAINLIPALNSYQSDPIEKDELEKIIQELQILGVIQPSQNPYFSPILLVRKTNDYV